MIKDSHIRWVKVVFALLATYTLLFFLWVAYVSLFPSHACDWLYADEIRRLREASSSILTHQQMHGEYPRLNRSSGQHEGPEFGLGQFIVLEQKDGSHDVREFYFDGPDIAYNLESGKLRCVP